MDTNGPILWRIVCRVCRWSFFWRIIEKFIFIEKRGEPLNWGSQGITIYIFSREFSLISLVSLFYLLFHVHVVVVHQGNCWEEVELHRQRSGKIGKSAGTIF